MSLQGKVKRCEPKKIFYLVPELKQGKSHPQYPTWVSCAWQILHWYLFIHIYTKYVNNSCNLCKQIVNLSQFVTQGEVMRILQRWFCTWEFKRSIHPPSLVNHMDTIFEPVAFGHGQIVFYRQHTPFLFNIKGLLELKILIQPNGNENRLLSGVWYSPLNSEIEILLIS